MQEQQALFHLRETLVFLALAGVLIPSLQRLRINPVLGFLAAGTLIGPYGLGSLADGIPVLHYVVFMSVDRIAPFADLGVLALMFMIGLELSAQRMWALRRWVFGAGIAQMALCTALIGGIAYAFENHKAAALVLGLGLSMSSTAVVMQLLDRSGTKSSSLRHAGFSILMLQDLAIVPIFILLGVLAEAQSEHLLQLAGMAFIKAVAALACIYVVGQRVIHPLFRAFAGKRQPDVFMALTLLSSLGIAGLAAATGLSMTLGAFLAGLLLAETEFRHEVEVVIEPFKGLLMGLFFMSVGMQIDVRAIMQAPMLLPVAVLGLFAIKGVVTSLVLRVGGFSWGRAVEGGLLLGQGGEFAFIVVAYAVAHGLLAPDAGQFMLLVVGLSLFATPFAALLGRSVGGWWTQRFERNEAHQPDAVGPLASHVLIAGFGRVGKLLAQVLHEQGIAYVALESSAEIVAARRTEGFDVYFGNASRAELLHKLHAGKASAIVLTMDDPASALHAVKAIRRDYPDIPVLARSRDERHAVALREAGANIVIPETLEAGLQLSAAALEAAGLSQGLADQIIDAERERRIALLGGTDERVLPAGQKRL